MVKAYPGDLHAKPARPATLSEFFLSNLIPILITVKLYISGFPVPSFNSSAIHL